MKINVKQYGHIQKLRVQRGESWSPQDEWVRDFFMEIEKNYRKVMAL